MTNLLEVKGLTVSIGATSIVSDFSLIIRERERVGVIGESGSGKTMVALGIIGLLPEGMSVSGSVKLAGEELTTAGERRRSQLRGDQISMVFQEPMSALNPVMRVGRQVAEVLRIHSPVTRNVARQRVIELLAEVGFDDPARQARAYPHQLSGGQRQRVMIAIAIARRPALLLADEPTTALDVIVQDQVLELMKNLVDGFGAALLLISHDLALVSSTCSNIVVMYGGRIVESGPTEDLLNDAQHPYTAGLVSISTAISPDNDRDGRPLATIPGSVPEFGAFPSGCVFRSRCHRATERCFIEPPLAGESHRVACWHPLSIGEMSLVGEATSESVPE